MIDLEENYRVLCDLKSKIDELVKTVDISKLKSEYDRLKEQTLDENFWQD